MKIVETTPRKSSAILPGADFADAWRVGGLMAGTDAEMIAARLFRDPPRWIGPLMKLRNILVMPFGLIRKPRTDVTRAGRVSFPVVSAQPNRVVLGFDDRHLDFRLVIDVEPDDSTRLSAIATTYVRTHNIGGRLYLMLVKPFHRRIVPAMLANAAQAA